MKLYKKSFLIVFITLILCLAAISPAYAEEYQYDALNRVVKVIYEDGSYVEYEYDSNGNLEKTVVHPVKVEDSKKDNEQKTEEKPSADNKDSSSGKEYMPKLSTVMRKITMAVYHKLHTGTLVPAVRKTGLLGRIVNQIIKILLKLIQVLR